MRIKSVFLIPLVVGRVKQRGRHATLRCWLPCPVLCFALVLGLAINSAYAQLGQFGKNNVRYNQLDKFYKSYRFDVRHNLDTNDPVQKEYLEMVVANLENARDRMSGQQFYNHTIKKRIPIFLYKTHADMESSNLVGGFLPEGVGAFVECGRRREVLKADFSKPLSRAIGVHELAHEFQCDILDPGFVDKVMNNRRPLWFHEGGAEFIAGLYEPHTRDDIRRDGQRIASSDRHFIPTWEACNQGRANPYSECEMIFELLEEKFSAGVAFQVQGFKQIKVGLGELLYDLTKGELGNPDVDSEKFNQGITRFWMDKYEDEFNARPKPDEKNDNFEGRLVMPWGHSAPMSSPRVSLDGKQLAVFTVFKYGVGLGKYEIPKDKIYVSKEEREKLADANQAFGPNGHELVNLTPQLPPIPWEGVISQLETWSFNGFDESWSPDGSKMAFFAKTKDHALMLIDAETGDVLRKIELPLDQAFSPSFASNGESLVFSAAKDTTRDIYMIKLESGEFENLTKDARYDTAPQFSSVEGKVVYVGSDGDFQHLFLMDLSNGNDRITIEQLTFGDFNDSWPSWSDDGSTIVYASDEADGIWNLYTLELSTRTVRQWTEFLLGSKTPVFAKGTTDTVYHVSAAEDTQSGGVFDKVFEAKLKKPIREYTVRDTGSAGTYVFNPSRDLIKFELDENQLLNPTPAPEQWECGGGEVAFGASTYWGIVSQGFVRCSNILETKHHLGRYVSYYGINIFDYSNINQEKRTTWLWGISHNQMPLSYRHYDIAKRFPKQPILNRTWVKESSLNLSAAYPFSKFKRLELYSKLRHRSFANVLNPDELSVDDLQVKRFLDNSTGSNFVFGTAYVRDTVLSSGNTWGPFHGNALRAQIEFAPPLGEEFQGYTSVNISGRTYRHLGSNSLFAGRVDLMANTRANGDYILFGGPEFGRGAEYGGIICNQCAYASMELRFPIPGTYLLGAPVRAFLYDDMAVARFSDERFPVQKFNIPGMGVQFFIPFVGLPAQMTWRLEDKRLIPTFYVAMPW
ncbi:MAG: PD40 domain-containing protein [Candidatus Yanofskybacteria bacterium]|nr:PD40 domain-containing protein [Candidatus Yanofskybacteria bacterium]